MANFDFTIGVLSVIGALIAAHLSYTIYTFNRNQKSWLALTIAFILNIVVRLIGFYNEFATVKTYFMGLKNVEGILIVLVFLLYIWGFWGMKKSFESFDLLQKQVSKKYKLFESKQKKKK